LDLVVGEDLLWVLNPLPIALPKYGMCLVFWVAVVGDNLTMSNTIIQGLLAYVCLQPGHIQYVCNRSFDSFFILTENQASHVLKVVPIMAHPTNNNTLRLNNCETQ
jgi:hypothetical protein